MAILQVHDLVRAQTIFHLIPQKCWKDHSGLNEQLGHFTVTGELSNQWLANVRPFAMTWLPLSGRWLNNWRCCCGYSNTGACGGKKVLSCCEKCGLTLIPPWQKISGADSPRHSSSPGHIRQHYALWCSKSQRETANCWLPTVNQRVSFVVVNSIVAIWYWYHISARYQPKNEYRIIWDFI